MIAEKECLVYNKSILSTSYVATENYSLCRLPSFHERLSESLFTRAACAAASAAPSAFN